MSKSYKTNYKIKNAFNDASNNVNALDIILDNCRHPNKKHHRKLLKEFKDTGVFYLGNNLVNFDSRWKDIEIRRKIKSIKKRGRELRRSRLKKQTTKMINEIEYDDN